ncbi:putative undecaprenyl-phosphate N-acetylglucosaminyl 1-phosphate transferase [bacterium HR11]|nr:putative undecaprenyl-phosphate N-acetylglucosaminyl 1-phosphate transferase [bacterium HR11]
MYAWTWPLAAVTAFGLTLAGVPLAAWLARRWNAIDLPGPRKFHTKPIPRLGGLAIFGAVIVTLGFFIDSRVVREGWAILGAGSLIAIVGFLDDMGRLHSQVKLFFAMPLSALLLIAAGIRAQVFPQEWLNVAITLLWVVGITCAFNLLDNMDGLTAGVSAIAAVFFTTLALLSGQRLVSLLGAATLGVSVGFLVYNFHPARIFMGDGGAMFLGFLMATLGLKIRLPQTPPEVSWMVPVLILGVPIFDTTLVTVSRLRRGLIPFMSPGKDHLSHRLHRLGRHPRQVALIHYGLSGLLGATALGLELLRVPVWGWGLGAIILATAAIAAIIALERVPFERQAGVPWRAVKQIMTRDGVQ